MIVVDASVVVPLITNGPGADVVRARLRKVRGSMCAPHVISVEVAHVLRRLERIGDLDRTRAHTALQLLIKLPLVRYGHESLLPRIWQLRGHVSAYDAAYVALAEGVRGTLLTRDARLAAVAGTTAQIEVI